MHKNKNVLKVVLPEDISPVDHPPIKNLWAELRIKKNICSRSYHSSVIYNSTLYVYGGYDTNEGILNDFYSLNLSSEDGYEFVSESQKGQYPGKYKFKLRNFG